MFLIIIILKKEFFPILLVYPISSMSPLVTSTALPLSDTFSTQVWNINKDSVSVEWKIIEPFCRSVLTFFKNMHAFFYHKNVLLEISNYVCTQHLLEYKIQGNNYINSDSIFCHEIKATNQPISEGYFRSKSRINSEVLRYPYQIESPDKIYIENALL